MSFKHGKNALVALNGNNLSAFLSSAGLAVGVDTSETSTFSSSWKSFIAGLNSATLTFAGFYDPVSVILPTVLGSDAQVLTFAPAGGSSIGDLARLASIASTTYGEDASVSNAVAVSWGVIAEGPVTFGQILHPFSVDTGTTTGATRDDSAATSTGWTAHLHVSAVSSGSWVIKLQDASASNFSDVADVTGGAFNAVTTSGGQRLTGATTGDTLRRYTRYVATATGGSSPTITFALAYARA